MSDSGDVIVSGLGVVSSLGIGIPTEPVSASARVCRDIADFGYDGEFRYLPFLPPNYETLIPKRADRKLMEDQFLLGCYAAGLALQDAKLLSVPELLRETALYVASDSPDRDAKIDAKIIERDEQAGGAISGPQINEILRTEVRPTAFLARIPNLLAGNISIVFGVTGTSRTFSGCEIGGVVALTRACKAVQHGLCERALAGAALNGSRLELLRWLYAGGRGLDGDFSSVWTEATRGVCLGSAGVFLVVESPQSAARRGVTGHCRITTVGERSSDRDDHADALSRLVAALPEPGLRPQSLVITNTSGAGLSDIETRFWRPYVESGIQTLSSAGLAGSCLEADVFLETALGIGALSGSRIIENEHACLGHQMNSRVDPPSDVLIMCSGLVGDVGAFRLEEL